MFNFIIRQKLSKTKIAKLLDSGFFPSLSLPILLLMFFLVFMDARQYEAWVSLSDLSDYRPGCLVIPVGLNGGQNVGKAQEMEIKTGQSIIKLGDVQFAPNTR